MNAHPVVLSHCATRARSSNPAGPSLRSGLTQEALGRAVKVADREDRLCVITNRLAWGTPAPEARGRRVGPALACGPARDGQHPGLCQVAPPCILPSARAWAGADRRVPRRPTRNAASPKGRAPTLPGTVDAIFRTKIGDFPHRLPPKTF